MSRPFTMGRPAFRSATSSWLNTRNSRLSPDGDGGGGAPRGSRSGRSARARPHPASRRTRASRKRAGLRDARSRPSGRPRQPPRSRASRPPRRPFRACRRTSASVSEDSRPGPPPVREKDDKELVAGGLVAADPEDVGLAEVHVDRRAHDLAADLPARLVAHALEGEVAELDLGAVTRRIHEKLEAIAAPHDVCDALAFDPLDDHRVETGEVGHFEKLLELLADPADLFRDVGLLAAARLLP